MNQNDMKFNDKLSAFFYRVILVFAIVILAFLSVSILFIHGHMESDIEEYMLLIRNGIDFYVLFILLLGVLFLIGKLLPKITAWKLFIVFTVLYVIAGIFFIVSAPEDIIADAYMIYKHAMKFMAGDYEGLTDGFYLRYFPFQLGMVTYEMGLLYIWNSTKVFFVANLIFALLTMFVAWKTTELLFDEEVSKYTIILSFAFLPMLYYILFAYGWIPGFFFVELGGYFLTRHIREKGRLNWLYCALSLGIAYIFKPNYIIAVAAIGIILFIEAVRKVKLQSFAICLLTIAIPIIFNAMFLQSWRYITGINFDGGNPSLNVVMGLMPEEEGVGRRGGWYNGYNMDTFRDSGFDQEKTKQAASEKLAELKDYWSEDPGRTASFFATKVWTGWCDPLYQSLWSGPLEDCGQFTSNHLARSFFTGGWMAIFSEKFMNALVAFLYISSCLYAVLSFRELEYTKEAIFPVLMLVGGFLFHLVSEIKSQYVFVYVFAIIPCAAAAFCRITNKRK